MARIIKIAELEQRKKALVAESEACRQVLHLELQNLRSAGYRWRRNFSKLSFANPLILAVLPLLTTLLRRRRRGAGLQVITAALFGWKMLRNVLGMASRLFLRKSRQRPHSEEEEQSAPM
jgi:hypothetical protein